MADAYHRHNHTGDECSVMCPMHPEYVGRERVAREEPLIAAKDAIDRASELDDPRNPPNAAGQVAIAKATYALAQQAKRIADALTRPRR